MNGIYHLRAELVDILPPWGCWGKKLFNTIPSSNTFPLPPFTPVFLNMKRLVEHIKILGNSWIKHILENDSTYPLSIYYLMNLSRSWFKYGSLTCYLLERVTHVFSFYKNRFLRITYLLKWVYRNTVMLKLSQIEIIFMVTFKLR